MKKILIISFLIIIILANLISTSYAVVPVTKENLNDAFEALLKLETDENTFDSITVSDYFITITEDGEISTLYYDLTNKPTFWIEANIEKGISYEEYQKRTENLFLPMYGYIAIANIQGIKLEDALAYFGFSYLAGALNSGLNQDAYWIYDDTNLMDGVTIEKNEDDTKTIYVSEFGDRVMEYVNSQYKDTQTINDSTAINSYSYTTEKKDVTATSCKLVSTISVNLNANFSELNGYSDKIGDSILGTDITKENADYSLTLKVGQKCKVNSTKKFNGHALSGSSVKISEDYSEITAVKPGVSKFYLSINDDKKTFYITVEENINNEVLEHITLKIDMSTNNSSSENKTQILTEIVDENGNVPAYKYYPKHVGSRSITELKAYDGKIFMGLGDWTDNTGPVHMLYYDTADGKIKTSGTIPDEAVQLFNVIDGELYTTGCDPRTSAWDFGSYYIYDREENKWIQHEKQMGWIHVFNIVKFKDKLYMCGSTSSNKQKSCIQSSADNGETFESVLVFKDGKQLPYENSLRCYNLAVYNNKLYGYINVSPYTGIYEYDETKNEFHYISKLPSSSAPSYGNNSLRFYNEVYFKYTEFNNEFIYISGGKNLYKSNDLKTFTAVPTQTQDVIQDVVISGDTLYTLSYAYNSTDKTYTTRIYKTKDLKKFEFVYEFISETPPFSIEYCDNNLYIGTGICWSTGYKDESKIGSLYKVDLTALKESNISNNTNTNNNNNNNSSANDYINNNNKLPQTGKFFEIKNLLQIVIIVSIVFLAFVLRKPKTLRNN